MTDQEHPPAAQPDGIRTPFITAALAARGRGPFSRPFWTDTLPPPDRGPGALAGWAGALAAAGFFRPWETQ